MSKRFLLLFIIIFELYFSNPKIDYFALFFHTFRMWKICNYIRTISQIYLINIQMTDRDVQIAKWRRV